MFGYVFILMSARESSETFFAFTLAVINCVSAINKERRERKGEILKASALVLSAVTESGYCRKRGLHDCATYARYYYIFSPEMDNINPQLRGVL